MNPELEAVGYGLAGLSFLILTVLILTSFRERLRGGLLAAAAILAAVWAFALATNASDQSLSPLLLFTAEIVHDGTWFAFFAALLSGAAGVGRYSLVRYGGVILVIILLVLGVVFHNSGVESVGPFVFRDLLIASSLLTSLYALVILEQIYRNARESQRQSLKFLCFGVGSIFVFDLVLYSNALFGEELFGPFWTARGYVVTMCVPLIAIAVQRSPSWSVGIFVSRQIVFYSATAFGAVIYLIAVSYVGHYLRVAGGTWGPVAQLILIAGAMLALLVFLFSDRSRARLRVFISKHFFENRYDYREEWLRLIDTLTDPEGVLPLRKRAIKALAQIVSSPSGLLWLQTDDASSYECVTGWDTPAGASVFGADHSLIRFMQRTGWVIEVREYIEDKSRY
jgi:putative PEP-CTERM system histidine kinase